MQYAFFIGRVKKMKDDSPFMNFFSLVKWNGQKGHKL